MDEDRMPEEYDPNAPEIRSAMSCKERLLLQSEFTPEETEELEEQWTYWTRGDKEREELFFAVFHLGMGIGAHVVIREAESTIADVKEKRAKK